MYASVIAVVFGLNTYSSKDTYSMISKLSANRFVTKNVRNLITKFDIGNIPIANQRFPNMCFIPKLHKTLLSPN